MPLSPLTLLAIPRWLIVLIIVLIIVVAVFVALYFYSKRQQKKMDENQAKIDANKQNITMLVIDKKKMRLKDAGLPQIVVDQTPKMMRRAKVPVVKAKVGPKITIFLCDNEIFDMVPVKTEIRATISGIYITNVRALRGPALTAPPKVGFWKRIKNKLTGKSAAAK